MRRTRAMSSRITNAKNRRLRAPVSGAVNDASWSSLFAERSAALRAATAASRRVRSRERDRVRYRTTTITMSTRTTAAAALVHQVSHHAGSTTNEDVAGAVLGTPAAENALTSKRYLPGGRA